MYIAGNMVPQRPTPAGERGRGGEQRGPLPLAGAGGREPRGRGPLDLRRAQPLGPGRVLGASQRHRYRTLNTEH